MNKPTEYLNFDWKPSDECTLRDFKQELLNCGWVIMDTTELNGNTTIHCRRDSRLFGDPFSEN